MSTFHEPREYQRTMEVFSLERGIGVEFTSQEAIFMSEKTFLSLTSEETYRFTSGNGKKCTRTQENGITAIVVIDDKFKFVQTFIAVKDLVA